MKQFEIKKVGGVFEVLLRFKMQGQIRTLSTTSFSTGIRDTKRFLVSQAREEKANANN